MTSAKGLNSFTHSYLCKALKKSYTNLITGEHLPVTCMLTVCAWGNRGAFLHHLDLDHLDLVYVANISTYY